MIENWLRLKELQMRNKKLFPLTLAAQLFKRRGEVNRENFRTDLKRFSSSNERRMIYLSKLVFKHLSSRSMVHESSKNVRQLPSELFSLFLLIMVRSSKVGEFYYLVFHFSLLNVSARRKFSNNFSSS